MSSVEFIAEVTDLPAGGFPCELKLLSNAERTEREAWVVCDGHVE